MEHVSSGGSWSSAYQALVNVSLSQRRETRSVAGLLGKDQKHVHFGEFLKGGGLCSPHPEAGIWIIGRGGGNLLSSSSRTARTPFPSGGHTSPRSTHGPFSLLTGDVLGLPVSGPLLPLLGQQISISILFQGGAFWGQILGKAKEAFKSLA